MASVQLQNAVSQELRWRQVWLPLSDRIRLADRLATLIDQQVGRCANRACARNFLTTDTRQRYCTPQCAQRRRTATFRMQHGR